ncbi:MAG: hypothetical protein VKK97_11030 [Synechococcaceae cyanobacterium]|nr:hypothetical protein [Synechococcaceae cyanobacterium]
MAFFLLLQWQGGGDVDYLRSGRWAYDATLAKRILTPLAQWQKAISAPIVFEDRRKAIETPAILHEASPKEVDAWTRFGSKLRRTWQRSIHSPSITPQLDGNDEDFVQGDQVPAESDNPSGPRLPPDFIGGSRKPGSSF